MLMSRSACSPVILRHLVFHSATFGHSQTLGLSTLDLRLSVVSQSCVVVLRWPCISLAIAWQPGADSVLALCVLPNAELLWLYTVLS